MTGGCGEAFLENPSPHRSLPKTCVARFNGNARDKDERRDAVFNVFVAGMTEIGIPAPVLRGEIKLD
jgi:hypothetical protein